MSRGELLLICFVDIDMERVVRAPFVEMGNCVVIVQGGLGF